MAKHWIKQAVAEGKGKLHKHLGVPEGEKIPEDKLRAASNSKNPTIRKEASLAATLKGLSHHSKKKPPTQSKMIGKMYKKEKKDE